MRMSSVAGIGVAVVVIVAGVSVTGKLWMTAGEMERVLDARKTAAESLATQLAYAAHQQDPFAVARTLQETVKRDPEILSAALRRPDGKLFAVHGDHQRNWSPQSEGFSTPTNLKVPIFDGAVLWGRVEICYTPISPLSVERLPDDQPGDS